MLRRMTRWTRELFVNPNAYVPNVLSALIGIATILAFIVLFLDRRERVSYDV
jgi:hypothetical protein